jgi:hypothetical protein
MKSICLAIFLAAYGLGMAAPAVAQDDDPPAATSQDAKTKAYDDAVKDLKRVDGPFPMYQRKKDLLLEIPEDKLGKIFLIQATLATGLDSAFMHAGMPVGGNEVDAFRFDRHEDSVWLIRPVISNRWTKGDAFAPGAERQFQEAILGSYKIEQQNPAKHLLLVNITKLFYGDVFQLSEMITSGLGGLYMLDSEKSAPESVKGFPDDTVVQMGLHYYSPRGGGDDNPLASLLGLGGESTLEDSRSAPVRVTYSVWYRKDDGYEPRFADPRVGFFTESFFSVDRYLNTNRTERYINRFHVVKKDPAAPVSDPVKPIVYTIDNSVPPAYRAAVKEGVLRWNKAFDALGYKNAIQVQDQPNDPDYDHADGRYNVIRMMVSPSSPFGAISLFRTDPFSGEILNASITLDGNLIRDLQEEHLRNQASKAGGKRALEVLLRNDQRTEPDGEYLFETPADEARKALQTRMAKYGWSNAECDYAQELDTDAVLSWYALQGAPQNVNKEEYVKRFLADTVSHEVGHTLGLRHNFAGSTNLTTAQLADDSLTNKVGTTASVMDYTPPNVAAILRGSGNFYSPVIGPYDSWAIQYGYEAFANKDTIGEKYNLARIAAESGRHGLAYMTDEDADKWNPYSVRFDEASDPLAFSQKTIQAMQRSQSYAIRNLPKPGEGYERRTLVLLGAYQRMFREGRTAARFIGGLVGSRNFKGDEGEKPTLAPVDPSLQRQAAKMIVHDFLSAQAFELPQSVLTSLSVDPESGGWTAPIRDFLGGGQQTMVAMMLSANTTDRLAENAYKVKNAYGLDEHFALVTGSIFEEVGNGKSISPLRRDLQRFTLSGLMTIGGAPAGAVNEDARMLANNSLKELLSRLRRVQPKGSNMDNMSRIHLKDMSDTISRFLARS